MSEFDRSFVFGDLRFDWGWVSVQKGDKRLNLTPFELRILEYVVVRRPSEVSTVAIVRHLYGREPSEHDINCFHSQLYTLRKKLQEANSNVAVLGLGIKQNRKYSAGLHSQAAE